VEVQRLRLAVYIKTRAVYVEARVRLWFVALDSLQGTGFIVVAAIGPMAAFVERTRFKKSAPAYWLTVDANGADDVLAGLGWHAIGGKGSGAQDGAPVAEFSAQGFLKAVLKFGQ